MEFEHEKFSFYNYLASETLSQVVYFYLATP